MSTSSDKDKGIVGCIDAITKSRRLSAFGMVPNVEKKKAKLSGRNRHKEGLLVRNLSTRADIFFQIIWDIGGSTVRSKVYAVAAGLESTLARSEVYGLTHSQPDQKQR